MSPDRAPASYPSRYLARAACKGSFLQNRDDGVRREKREMQNAHEMNAWTHHMLMNEYTDV